MADRGRKAFPVSSHLCDERWQRHCMDLHKQRLTDMKHRIDNTKPETFDIVLSKGKRAMLDKERQTEVDRENAILLQKMVRIKEQDTRAVFRPWTARSTFQWKAGHYYDPATNTKTLDHINLTSSVSPRSIHYFALTRPGTAPPDVTARLRDMQIQVDNTKLLRAITTMRTHYDNDELERRHGEESILVNRISNFRGPEYARYQPPGRSSSASRNSPYLAPQHGRASSSNRPPRPPRVGWPASSPPISQERYFEEAQNRDIPPPSSRGNSRPGTALGGTQEGLGETSPRYGASRHSSSRPSLSRHSSSRHSSQDGEPAAQPRAASGSAPASAAGSNAGSRPGSAPAGSTSGSRPTSAAPGASFSFGAEQEEEQERQASARSEGRRASATSSQRSAGGPAAAAAADPGASGDDYADDAYDQDDQDDKDEQEADEKEYQEEEEEEEQTRASAADEDGGEEEAARNSGYGEDAFDADADADAAADEDADAGASARAEEEPEADEDAAPEPDGGDEDDGAAASAEGEAAAAEEPEAAQDEEARSQSEKKSDAGGDAFEDDPEAELRGELRAAEEAEMDGQFAAEMAADADDDYGVIAPAASVGGASYNTAASPKVGGFAADWD